MPRIEGGRWGALLRSLFGTKGELPLDLDDLIHPVAIVQPHEDEMYRERGERLFWGGAERAAVAGQRGYVQLRNASSFQDLVIVDDVILSSTTQSDFYFRYGTQALAASTGVLAHRDQRYTQNVLATGSVCQINDVTAAALPAGVSAPIHGRITCAGPPHIKIKVGVVIPPGASLVVENFTQNALIGVLFRWRERPFNPAEA